MGPIEITDSKLNELITAGDVLELHMGGERKEVIFIRFTNKCNYNTRVNEMISNPKANEQQLRSILCEHEKQCLGFIEVIELKEESWIEASLCWRDRISKLLTIKPIDCQKQKEIECLSQIIY